MVSATPIRPVRGIPNRKHQDAPLLTGACPNPSPTPGTEPRALLRASSPRALRRWSREPRRLVAPGQVAAWAIALDYGAVGSTALAGELAAVQSDDPPRRWNRMGFVFTVRFQRRGGRKRIVAPDGSELAPSSKPQPDGTLVKALARARRWQCMLESGEYGDAGGARRHRGHQAKLRMSRPAAQAPGPRYRRTDSRRLADRRPG